MKTLKVWRIRSADWFNFIDNPEISWFMALVKKHNKHMFTTIVQQTIMGDPNSGSDWTIIQTFLVPMRFGLSSFSI